MPNVQLEEEQQLDLKRRAFEAVAGLDRSAAVARQLDASLRPGTHGRRRRGAGEEFWQFRPAADGDPAKLIDWRRSAKSDGHFVREKEMQISNSVMFWADNSGSMQFSGGKGRPTKADRSRLIALSAAIMLLRSEERVGILGRPQPPSTGLRNVDRLALELCRIDGLDYGLPVCGEIPRGARVVLLSDFLAPLGGIRESTDRLAAMGADGVLVQLLDPLELNFPFEGRTLFRSMSGSVEFETMKAGGIKAAFREVINERISSIRDIAGRLGWRSGLHVTDSEVRDVICWVCRSLGPEA